MADILETMPMGSTSDLEAKMTAAEHVQAGQALVIQAQASQLHASIRSMYELDWSLPRQLTPSAKFLINRFHKANKVERVTGPLIDAFELRVVQALSDGVMSAECAECVLQLMLHANDDNAKVLVLKLMSARVTEACRANMVERGMLRIIKRWLMARDCSNGLLKKLLQVLRGLNVTVASLKESGLGFVVQKVKRDLRAKAKAIEQNAGDDVAKMRAAEELKSLTDAADQVVKAWRGRLGLDGPEDVESLRRADHTEHASRKSDTLSEAGPVTDAHGDGSAGEATNAAAAEDGKDGEACEGLGESARRTHGDHAASAAIQQGDESSLELRQALDAAAHVDVPHSLHHEDADDQVTPMHVDGNSACMDDTGHDMHEAHHALIAEACMGGGEAVLQTDGAQDDHAPTAPSAFVNPSAQVIDASGAAATATTTPQPPTSSQTASAAEPVHFTWRVRGRSTEAEDHAVRVVVGTQPLEVRSRGPRISWADHHGRALEHMCTDEGSVRSAERQSGQSGSGVPERSTPHGARHGAVIGGEEAGMSDADEEMDAGGSGGSACGDAGHDEAEESVTLDEGSGIPDFVAFNTREGAAESPAAVSQPVPGEADAQGDVVPEKEDVGDKGWVKLHADGCSASRSADVGDEVADTSVMEEHGYKPDIVVQNSFEGAAAPSIVGDDSTAGAAKQELRRHHGGDTDIGEEMGCLRNVGHDAAGQATEVATVGDAPHTNAVTKHEKRMEHADGRVPSSALMSASAHTASTESDSSSSGPRLKRAWWDDTQGEECQSTDSAGGAVCGKRMRDEVMDEGRNARTEDTRDGTRDDVDEHEGVKRAKDRHKRRPSIERCIPRNVREQRKHMT